MISEDKFLEKIEFIPEHSCWEWTGYKTRTGYGKYRTYYAHRFSYEKFKNPIRPGMVLDHACKNRGCVNPAHLRQVSQKENVLVNSDAPSAKNKAKTHCKRGHAFDLSNTYIKKKDNYTMRICRECHRLASLNSYYKNK